MAESKIGTENECQDFSYGTDKGTEDWWYHGCSERDALEILSGEQVWKGSDERCFTRDPHGADQQHGTAVIRAMLHLNKPPDRYFIEDSGITAGFPWIKMYDASAIMFDREYLGSAVTGLIASALTKAVKDEDQNDISIFHTTTSENAKQIKLNGFVDPQAKAVGDHVCVPMEEGTYFADQAMIDNSLDSGASYCQRATIG